MYFDDYNLAQNIAWVSNNKIPILTGIGHEQDITIPDYVSYMRFSTPTEVARAIVNQIENYNKKIDENFQNIIYSINNIFTRSEIFSKNILNNLSSLIDQFFEEERNKMIMYSNSIKLFDNIIRSNELTMKKEFKFFEFFSQYIENNINNFKRINDNTEEKFKNIFDLYISNVSKKLDNYYIEMTKNSPFSSFLSGGAILVQNSQIIDSVYKVDEKKELEIKLYDGEINTKIKEIRYYRRKKNDY
ncbi:exodeoxyribonuclease VII large subunit [Marinitoga lauensis]|uniref:exodeoxyribonuclease VII large subunit n=1 Tax=Marinitoga lauensis TaxID=2201189 RepID=UPI00101139B3|nr:exodeoxyribonuclease VII large subunit [Marinitoga lauensis]